MSTIAASTTGTTDPFIESIERELTAGRAGFYAAARKGDRAAVARANRRMIDAMDLLDSLYGPAGWSFDEIPVPGRGSDARLTIVR